MWAFCDAFGEAMRGNWVDYYVRIILREFTVWKNNKIMTSFDTFESVGLVSEIILGLFVKNLVFRIILAENGKKKNKFGRTWTQNNEIKNKKV